LLFETKLLDSQAGSGGTGDNNRRRLVNADVVNPGMHETDGLVPCSDFTLLYF
jgi:hypothetical protein